MYTRFVPSPIVVEYSATTWPLSINPQGIVGKGGEAWGCAMITWDLAQVWLPQMGLEMCGKRAG